MKNNTFFALFALLMSLTQVFCETNQDQKDQELNLKKVDTKEWKASIAELVDLSKEKANQEIMKIKCILSILRSKIDAMEYETEIACSLSKIALITVLAAKYGIGVCKRFMFYVSAHNPFVGSSDKKADLQMRYNNLYNAYQEYFLTWILKPDCLRSKPNWEKMRNTLQENALLEEVYVDNDVQEKQSL